MTETADVRSLETCKLETKIMGQRIDALNKVVADLTARLARLRQAVVDEPELPGPMPDEMWITLQATAASDDRAKMEFILQRLVGITKDAILQRIDEEVSREQTPT